MSKLGEPVHQQIEDLSSQVEGSFLLNRKVHVDDRGTFCEFLRKEWPILPDFVQENVSFSFGGVIRGMHTQSNNPQGKLVTCTYGTVLDVIFDIRKGSKTFGNGVAKMLDHKGMNSLYCPPGCLHGFLALSRFAVVHYACTTYYEKQSDGGVRWDSPEIRSFFPEEILPLVSQKDQNLPLLSEYLETIK